jgi:hypothetical protein
MGKQRIKIDLLIHDLKVPIAVIEAGVTSLLERTEKYGPLTEKQRKVIKRILRRTKENYQSNALTEQAYANNLKKFEPVDLSALKSLFPALHILHLVVDTSSNKEDEWFVVQEERRF